MSTAVALSFPPAAFAAEISASAACAGTSAGAAAMSAAIFSRGSAARDSVRRKQNAISGLRLNRKRLRRHVATDAERARKRVSVGGRKIFVPARGFLGGARVFFGKLRQRVPAKQKNSGIAQMRKIQKPVSAVGDDIERRRDAKSGNEFFAERFNFGVRRAKQRIEIRIFGERKFRF